VTEAQAAAAAPTPSPPAAPVDGRTARAQRTRDAIVEACVGLVTSGELRPTAPRIAEEAGVSVRSVFQHFDDLETLFALVAERAIMSLAGLVHPIDPDLPLDQRIERFATQRVELLEALTPIRRAAAVHAPFSPAIQARVAAGHQFFRAELEAVFGRELDGEPERREVLLDMLDIAASWSSWDQLRAFDGRSVEEASTVVAAMLRAVLPTG
jgi:TetR/AcrR family transcriptional regulator of autoinduction and epiphytic fitness